jgi:hypothetical protein
MHHHQDSLESQLGVILLGRLFLGPFQTTHFSQGWRAAFFLVVENGKAMGFFKVLPFKHRFPASLP